MPALNDYLLKSVLVAQTNLFVRLQNNVTGVSYISDAVTDANGKMSFTTAPPPPGSYTVYTGGVATIPGTPNPTGDSNYLVPDLGGGNGKPMNKGGAWYDIAAYGGLADSGTTDNTAAIANAAADAKVVGGTVFVPPSTGLYQCLSSPNLLNLINVRFLGAGAGPSNTVGSWLVFNGTGAGNGFDFTGGNGVTVQSLGFGYANAGFTGSLVKWAVTNGSIRDSSLRGIGGPTSATYLLNLDTANDCFFDRVFFNYAQYCVLGLAPAGGSFSNVVSFRNCDFDSQIVVSHVRSPGTAWAFFNCDFENLVNLTGSALVTDGPNNPTALSYTGCWFGDATSATPFTWLLWHGFGLTIKGCYFSQGVNFAGIGIRCDQTSTGLEVGGGCAFSHLNVGIALGAGLVSGVVILPSDYTGTVTPYTGTPSSAGPSLIMPPSGTATFAGAGNTAIGSTNAVLIQVNGNSTANVDANRVSLFKGLSHQKQSPVFNAGPTPDPTLGEIYAMAVLTGNVNVGNPVNGVQGDRMRLYWTQDGTGTRAVAYTGTNLRSVGIAAQSTAAGTVTIDEMENIDGTIWRVVRLVTGQTV